MVAAMTANLWRTPLLLVFLSVGMLAPRLPAAPPELRAAWVASVSNLNFPAHSGQSAAAQREQIHRIVDRAANCGLNALMVQVRPESDALYASDLEPWSRYLTGKQGGDPGYDPLATFIAEGRQRGVAIHAWLNPFRAASGGGTRAASHISNRFPGSAKRIGHWLWMDPGDPAVRARVVSVAADIVRRYAVAGVVLDDYFYPYPGSGIPRGTFPDQDTFARYGQGATVGDWRRHNVDELVHSLKVTLASLRPGVQFGVSPFGIYRPNVPAGVEARVDQYAELYSDPVRWLREGWVDYLSPQLYWPDAGPQSYSALLRWWRSPAVNPRGVPIYPSVALDRLGGEGFNWPTSEIAHQLSLERSLSTRGGEGFILWSVGPLLRDQKGIDAVVAAAR